MSPHAGSQPLPRPPSCGESAALPLRVLIVDDHPIFRQSLRMFLETDPTLQIVGEAGDGEEALARARETWPQVVCMDVSMPRLNGIAATRRLLVEQPGVKVIGLSAYDDRCFGDDMLAAGAVAYLTKSEAGDALLPLIRRLAGWAKLNMEPA